MGIKLKIYKTRSGTLMYETPHFKNDGNEYYIVSKSVLETSRFFRMARSELKKIGIIIFD